MAILKHIASKSSNYGAALEYLIFKHDELRKTPILDQNGNRTMRDEFYLDGLNCEPYSFDVACQQLNREYQKNKNKNEIKSHHYIISFDPRDSTENCLTGKRAQELGLEYAKANFPGHQALVCTHMDGHNGSGNIHVHIVINSLRKLDVPKQPFMERPIDCKAGCKHHVTNEYLKHLQKSLMDLCRREFLHQVDLLSPSRTGVTEAEYWAQRRLDSEVTGKPLQDRLYRYMDDANLSISEMEPYFAYYPDKLYKNLVETRVIYKDMEEEILLEKKRGMAYKKLSLF